MITFEDFQYILSAIISITFVPYIVYRILQFVPELMAAVVKSILNKSIVYSNDYLDLEVKKDEKERD